MIAQSIVAEIAQRLHQTGHGAKRALVESEAQRLGVSPNTLYAQIRALAGRTRKVRADKGTFRVVALSEIEAVAQVKAKCEDTLHGRRLPTEVAIEVAEKNGMIGEGSVNRSTYDRAARQLRLTGPKHIFSRWQAQRANQLHHVDSSQSKYLHVVGQNESGEWLLSARKPEYTRKRSVEPMGLWCTAVYDDCSRVGHALYAVAAGESAMLVIEALKAAWSGAPSCALRGMPESLLCDHGPLRRSQEGQHFCDAVGVAFEDRMPKSPWVGGKVERPWRTMFSRFELPFCLKVEAVYTLSDLNRMLASYVDQTNNWSHPYYLKQNRLAVYAERLDAESVRYIPEQTADAVWRDDWRLVRSDCTLRYKNDWYLVPDECVGQWVKVIVNAEGLVMVECDGVAYPTKAHRPHDAGDYRAHAYTPAKHIEQGAQGLEVHVLPQTLAQSSHVHLHTGPTVQLDTPFNERTFANAEEARQALCQWSGLAWHEMTDEMRRVVENILKNSPMLQKQALMELAQNLRAARA